MAADPSLEWRARLRVLCLHGRCQTATTFGRKLEKLLAKAASFAEFAFVDGPLELPLQHGERVNTRGWWAEDAERRDEGDGQVRETLAKAWSELGPFDGVLGFSEGASAAVALCQLAARAEAEAAGGGGELEALTGRGLRFAVLAGAPAPAPGAAAVGLPSLHFLSEADTVVPAAESRRAAALFPKRCTVVEHDGGHSLPQRVEHVRRFADFLQERREELYPLSGTSFVADDAGEEEDPLVNDDQREELEALRAMFPEELGRAAPRWPLRLSLRLAEGTALRFLLPPGYPSAGPCRCELASEHLGMLAHGRSILDAAEAERAPVGFPSVAEMYQAAKQWVEDHDAKIAGAAAAGGAGHAAGGGTAAAACEGDEEEDMPADAWWLQEEGEVDEVLLQDAELKAKELLANAGGASWARSCGAGSFGKSWEFVVGLVGKPSAGKSTFFNAATRPEPGDSREAAMAPHPFTTIDPNVGPGWFAAPCPSAQLDGGDLAAAVRPEHGPAPGRRRRHPLLVKDVAGLVPGAYLGRGRGNAFLNDLCDADSLVHVVDASGRSDREGVDQGAVAGSPGAASSAATDPLDEVGWVRREIHLWIFCNLRAKWESVRKKARVATTHTAKEALADRLFGLLTGYHASKQLVLQVYEAAGFSLVTMPETVLNFGEYDLHLLVACFLRVRFPIVVALNKIDVPEAAERVAKAVAALGDACVPVSARSEWWLHDQQRRGHLTYTEGAGAESIVMAPDAPWAVQDQWGKIRPVLERYGRTGVQEALSVAVSRRCPLFVCPVVDLASLEPLQRSGSKAVAALAAPLASMILLRPLSTVEEAFAAMKHQDMLRGDFVRAEVLDLSTKAVKVLKREDVLGKDHDASNAIVLKVLTNKKAK